MGIFLLRDGEALLDSLKAIARVNTTARVIKLDLMSLHMNARIIFARAVRPILNLGLERVS